MVGLCSTGRTESAQDVPTRPPWKCKHGVVVIGHDAAWLEDFVADEVSFKTGEKKWEETKRRSTDQTWDRQRPLVLSAVFQILATFERVDDRYRC